MQVEEKLMSPEEQYELALTVSCPWYDCGAVVGQRCNGDVFPQYPHTCRLEKALSL
jgi:hypothetical protein